MAVIVLIVATGSARSAKPAELSPKAAAVQAFLGDPTAAQQLASGGLEEIRALEALFEFRYAADAQALKELVQQAKSEDPAILARAHNRLAMLPPHLISRLEALMAEEKNEAARKTLERARQTALRAKSNELRMVRLLQHLYVKNTTLLAESYWLRLREKPNDASAMRFYATLPFEEGWKLVKGYSRRDRLRFLLLRWFVYPDEMTEKTLHDYLAEEILELAPKTYWPYHVKVLDREDNQAWATFAVRREDNVLIRPLQLAAKLPPPDSLDLLGPWVEMRSWYRFTYIFRLEESYGNKEAMVYAEPMPNVTGRLYWPDEPGIEAMVALTSPEILGARLMYVHGVPANIALPTASLTYQEMPAWKRGSPFEWSRPLFPPHLRERLNFLPNAYPEPRVKWEQVR